MAKIEAAWGIDIGNSSLKAVRCRLGDRPDRIVADAFDYIEYPKILTQPGAEPEELISDALAQFQARNSVRGDQVAIGVSGQSGLARFIKLPPVEAKRIPDIVKYEARQQIPFDLQDVIWDYQQIGGGMEVEGFVLEAEVGIFAMKRDQVFRALEPFRAVGIDVDCVQLAPLALYNFVIFDQLHDLPPADEYDPEDPPPSYIVLSMGTDATDLVITNGYRVWQRSIPLGGNHFTKALTKELRLTFAKAEHLKRNASTAQDPKAVFQAMRPVFNDLLTEIQRSITYFTSIDRAAKIGKIVPLGNAMKLPGLQRYLGQSLGYDVVRLDSFRGLVGAEVVGAPAFTENLLSFGPCYGLALQALGRSTLKTNLLPRDIVKDRLIRQKKPWAVAAAAVLLLGFTITFFSLSRAMANMGESVFGDAEQEAAAVISESKTLKGDEDSAAAKFTAIDEIGKNLVGNVEGRIRWLELLKALDTCLPKDPDEGRPEQIGLRNELHVVSLDAYHMERLEDWFAARRQWYQPAPGEKEGAGTSAAATANAADANAGRATPAGPDAMGPGAARAAGPVGSGAMGPGAAGARAAGPADSARQTPSSAPRDGPTGPGWVVRLSGYHYHNRSAVDPQGSSFIQGARFVRETLIKGLQASEKTVLLPKGDAPGDELVSMKELGISYPVLVNPGQIHMETVINPNAEGAFQSGVGPGMGPGVMPGMGPGAMGYSPEGAGMMPGYGPRTTTSARKDAAKDEDEEEKEDPVIELMRFDFEVEFCWQPKLPSERHQKEEPQPEQELEQELDQESEQQSEA